jgi:uncharacterized protein YodC (DUF2158 family)
MAGALPPSAESVYSLFNLRLETYMFADGDEVILKSGGPVMTVEGTHARTGRLICIWFEGTKRMMSLFHPVTLKKWRGDGCHRPTMTPRISKLSDAIG